MKKEMKIILPVYKMVYAFAFVVILSLIRGVVFTNEIGLSIEGPFAILIAVFCADTYVQEITSNRSEVQRLYKQYGGTLYDTAIFAVQHACEKWVAAL